MWRSLESGQVETRETEDPTALLHQLTSDSTSYRYWLVWVTTLGNHDSLAIDEVVLYKQP